MINFKGIFPTLTCLSVLCIYYDKREYVSNYFNFIIAVISIGFGFIFIICSVFILHLQPIKKFEDSWDSTKKGKLYSLYWLLFTDLRNILMGFCILQIKTEILLLLLVTIELIALKVYFIIEDDSLKAIFVLKIVEKLCLIFLLITLLGVSICSISSIRNVNWFINLGNLVIL